MALAANSLSARSEYQALLAVAGAELRASLRAIGQHIDTLEFSEAAALLAQSRTLAHSKPS